MERETYVIRRPKTNEDMAISRKTNYPGWVAYKYISGQGREKGHYARYEDGDFIAYDIDDAKDYVGKYYRQKITKKAVAINKKNGGIKYTFKINGIDYDEDEVKYNHVIDIDPGFVAEHPDYVEGLDRLTTKVSKLRKTNAIKTIIAGAVITFGTLAGVIAFEVAAEKEFQAKQQYYTEYYDELNRERAQEGLAPIGANPEDYINVQGHVVPRADYEQAHPELNENTETNGGYHK